MASIPTVDGASPPRESKRFSPSFVSRRYVRFAAFPAYLAAQSFMVMRKVKSIPKAETQSTSTSPPPPFQFAACLMTKDDNQILPEWLAYHYTTTPLRRVIVADDPFSLTAPHKVLNEFREIGMNITLWHEEDFHSGQHNVTLANGTVEEMYRGYLLRQRRFLNSCIRQLRAENHTWTLFIDNDEFITMNNYNGQEEGMPYDCTKLEDELQKQNCSEDFHAKMRAHQLPRAHLPVNGTANSRTTLAHVIAGKTDFNPQALFGEFGCVCFPRVLFGPQNSTQEQVSAAVPPGFDPYKYRTFKYRKHEAWQSSYPGKCIVDLSRNRDVTSIKGVHKTLPENRCYAGPHVRFHDAVFRVHHYTGSFEEYISRPGDSSRTPKGFQKRTSFKLVGDGDDSLRGWLQQFVNLVGTRQAMALTEKLRDWATVNDAVLSTAAPNVDRAN